MANPGMEAIGREIKTLRAWTRGLGNPAASWLRGAVEGCAKAGDSVCACPQQAWEEHWRKHMAWAGQAQARKALLLPCMGPVWSADGNRVAGWSLMPGYEALFRACKSPSRALAIAGMALPMGNPKVSAKAFAAFCRSQVAMAPGSNLDRAKRCESGASEWLARGWAVSQEMAREARENLWVRDGLARELEARAAEQEGDRLLPRRGCADGGKRGARRTL